ncbi:MAG: glycosyltransferase, partial [Candidatus Omnitrophota bacterium]
MQPSISIIIPAYNADRTIAQTLEACLAQDYPKDALEIIVVDDGSTDDTKDIVARYPVRYIAQKNAGPAAARNRGWRAAKGELICFTDADCIPEKAWATKIARGYESDNVGAVGGSYDIANPRSLLASCIHQEILARHESMPRSVRALGSYNLSVRRELLERVGGFDEMYRTSSGEDNDLSYRLLREGKQLMFDRSIVVAHHHPENLGRYLRTQFWHGYWRVRLYLGHPSMAQGDDYSGIVDYLQPVVAVAAVGAGALAPLLPIAGKIAAALLVIEVALQVPMIARVVRRAPRARYLFLLFVTFMRAFARGLGMARGVLRAVTKHRTRLFMVACVSGALMLAGGAGARCDDTDASPKKFSASDPGEIRKAIEYLKGQQASNPDDPGTREQLAQAYNYYAIQCSAQDMASAIEYMQRAVDLSPGNAAYRKSLGMLYLKVGYGYYQAKEMQRASDTVKSSLAADPENVEALALMGAIFYADGKTAEALGCWSRGLELAPQNDVLVQNIQRVRKEITAQTTFKKRETQNFVFTFAEGLNEFKFGNMESILNEVYVKIGQAFSYFPTYRVTVEIYP